MKYDTAEETGGLDFYGGADVARERERQEVERRDEQARLADARALWAYRVAMAVGARECEEHDKCPTPEVMHPGGPGWAVCWTRPGLRHGVIHKQGHTPEEAMLHFAEAVFDTLPADVRARLGAKP